MNSNSDNRRQEEDFSQIHLSSTRVITWKVRDFEDLPEDAAFTLDSPPFDFENATWCLRLYPNAEDTFSEREDDEEEVVVLEGLEEIDDDYPFVGLTVVRLRSLVPCHKLHCTLIWKEDSFAKHSLVVQFDDSNKEHGSMNFIDVDALYDSSSSETGVLTLICQMSSFESPRLDACSQTELLTKSGKAIETLCQNFKNLLLNGADHDVVLKVKDREFRAHRNILRSRSSVLDAMLSHDMIEKSSGVIDIPDCDPCAFEQFLHYLYCAEVEALDAGNMLALYYIADKYDMAHLTNECRAFIEKSLTSSNVTDVIQLAINHSDAELLQCTTEYFVNEVNEILPTAEWQTFLMRNTAHGNGLVIKAVRTLSEGKA